MKLALALLVCVPRSHTFGSSKPALRVEAVCADLIELSNAGCEATAHGEKAKCAADFGALEGADGIDPVKLSAALERVPEELVKSLATVDPSKCIRDQVNSILGSYKNSKELSIGYSVFLIFIWPLVVIAWGVFNREQETKLGSPRGGGGGGSSRQRFEALAIKWDFLPDFIQEELLRRLSQYTYLIKRLNPW